MLQLFKLKQNGGYKEIKGWCDGSLVKVAVVKHEDVSSISGTHMVVGEKSFPQVVL